MADHGTVELITVTALDAMIYQPSAYGTPILSAGHGAVQYLTVESLATIVSPLTGYSIAGTLQQEPCPECPECPPPARFSLALGATPLGLALGDADT